ncbi:unnamed protein product [Rotaria magnacalcarata]|uniref:EF-hand domain-containing protein n=1 Tax=Rotaria magnacalcarata TaxID=392030 RepID=A0A816KFC7_9BILA|nr:unnamed protein product [Rotaria magnacalcarata]CAF1919274.1 unnamed protein product [Rotaria magnacalcarata]
MTTHDAYELKLLFSLFDTNHDGCITYDEIKQLVETVSGQIWTEEQLVAFMKIVDMDNLSADGVVDKQEFDQVMKDKGKDLNQDQINIFSNKFQQDENCKVTYEEFMDGAMEVYKNIKFN